MSADQWWRLASVFVLLGACSSDDEGSVPKATSAIVVTETVPREFLTAGLIGTIGFDADHCVLIKGSAEDTIGEVVVWPRGAAVDEAAGTVEIVPGNVLEAGEYYLFTGGMIPTDSAMISTDLNPAASACMQKAEGSIWIAELADPCTPELCPDLTLPEG